MGRMDGDMIDCAGEARTIEGWRQECERLRKENAEFEAECWRVRDRVTQLETQLKAGRQCVAERDEEIERLKEAKSAVGRGYRSVTVYADGTVEVDRSFDDDDQPVSRRAL